MRPFKGLRVLDLTHVFAGPFCTHQLAVLGAEVIKIEPVDRPDMTRAEGADAELNALGMGLSFQAQGGGKRMLALDLKSEEGRALFDDLVATADVVVQNFTASATEVLKLDYERLSAIKPDLIYCSITGFGATGPKRADPAYDTVIQAYSGAMAANGNLGQEPVRIGPAVIDYGTGAQAALAVSAALFGRVQTGQGRRIDVAMADCALMLMNSHTTATLATGTAPRPHGNADPSLAGYATYETADGNLMIGAFTNAQMAALLRSVDRPDEAEAIEQTPRAQIGEKCEAVAAILKQVMLTNTADQWETILNANHVPAARVRNLEETLQEPQLKSRGVVQQVDGRDYTVAGFSYDAGSPVLDHAPRVHGADSRQILQELGVDTARFDDLASRSVVLSPS